MTKLNFKWYNTHLQFAILTLNAFTVMSDGNGYLLPETAKTIDISVSLSLLCKCDWYRNYRLMLYFRLIKWTNFVKSTGIACLLLKTCCILQKTYICALSYLVWLYMEMLPPVGLESMLGLIVVSVVFCARSTRSLGLAPKWFPLHVSLLLKAHFKWFSHLMKSALYN